MSFWRAQPSMGGWIGVGLTLIVLATVAMLVALLVSSPISLLSFCLGVLTLAGTGVLVTLAYWTHGYYTLYYTLDRNSLRIHWTGLETTIPISDIREIMVGETDRQSTWLPFLRWLGYCIGRGRISGVGEVLYYASDSGRHQLLIVTDDVSYAISPEDAEGFRQALELRQSLGPMRRVAPMVSAHGLLGLSLWADALAQRLGAMALVLNLALFAYLCAVYANLAPVIPIHFDAMGQVNRTAPSTVIFFLPAIGAFCLVLNGLLGSALHSRHRLATLLLWGGSSAVQLYLWLATLGITSHSVGT